MAAIILPRKHYTQPQGRVQVAPEWTDFVLSATIGGTFYNVAQEKFEEYELIASGTNQGGSCDVPTGDNNSVIETAEPGADFLILCAFRPQGLSGLKQIIAYDSSSVIIDRKFQFRTNGTNLEFIRFNTANSAFTASRAIGIPQGAFGVIAGWTSGLSFGAITPAGESSVAMTGTPSSWGAAATLARWYSRRTNSTPQEASAHQSALRAILTDPGSQEIRRSLQQNPYQIFRADPHRIYSLPPVITLPTLSSPGVIDIGTTSARPQVTLTY